MSTYYMKSIYYQPTEDTNEFMDYIEHLKENHKIKITIEENENYILYFGELPSGDKDLYGMKQKNRTKYHIEQCKLWHKKLPKEECKQCEYKECENANKEKK